MFTCTLLRFLTRITSHEEIVFATRGYLIQIGGILMPDIFGNLVHIEYLLMIADLRTVANYNWGSAILYFLYHEM